MLHPVIVEILTKKRKRMNKIQRGLPLDNFIFQYPHAVEKSLAYYTEKMARKLLSPYLSYIRRNSSVKLDQNYDDLEGYSRNYLLYLQSINPEEEEDKDLLLFFLTLYHFNRNELFRFMNRIIGMDFEGNTSWKEGQDKLFKATVQKEVLKNVIELIEKLKFVIVRDSIKGKTFNETWETFQKKTIDFYEKKLPLIARNVVGNTFAFITTNMMQAIGVESYFWKVIMDEKLRGNPEGKYKNSNPSHYVMEGLLCRFDDPLVYSEDKGKTWIMKHGKMELKHYGQASNCRCTFKINLKNEIKEIDKGL